ncbi:DsbA family protein [Zhongshania sp. BJYM1]|uniref:DsbA family protein n=1 Tax=Zhongshania aquatica TaxID=2965069 RepID=UPI0022B311C9|nr:DsbA family protein [Marortus sp. BJYM1]
MSFLTPYVFGLVTSRRLQYWQRALAERRRKKAQKPHTVTVYLRINDPYSYILLQVLESLSKRYDIEYDFRTVLRLQKDMYPAPTLWESNAFADSGFLAKKYGLEFPDSPPAHAPELALSATAQLLHSELQNGYLSRAAEIFKAYWQDQSDTLNTLIDKRISANLECYQHHLLANETLLKDNGHYLSAMLKYGENPGGEWYWGLSRLEYLEQRLTALGALKNSDIGAISTRASSAANETNITPLSKGDNHEPITMYWSARSPYSYIGLVRARELAQRYGIPLVIKPVLPMVMRRMQVPRQKGMYIIRDTKREAEKYGIPFGFSADPLGSAVERCYALVNYANSNHIGNEFLDVFARSVWAEGIDAATDSGMKKIVEASGLNWSTAKPLLGSEDWRDWAQENLLDMYDKGLWGVPSFSYGGLSIFGQDRLDRLEQEIINTHATSKT